jgi:hypothetical protein
MSFVKLQGNPIGTGILNIVSPITDTSRTLTLPTQTTEIAGIDNAQTFTDVTLGSGLVMATSPLTSTAEVATTSGTELTIATNLPSWIVRFSVLMYTVSLNGTSRPLIQFGIGSTPTYVTTGYASGSDIYESTIGPVDNVTTGFVCGNGSQAAYQWNLIYTFIKLNASDNTWVGSMRGGVTGIIGATSGGGRVTLSEPLTAVRLTSPSLNTFDLGSVSIVYG